MAEESELLRYDDIAKAVDLDPETAARFVQYMRIRWAKEETRHCQVGYAEEWALRFKHRLEYAASDSTGQAILLDMTRRDYGRSS